MMKFRKFMPLYAVVISAITISFIGRSIFAAGTASFSLAPSSGSYVVNSSLSVTVNVNTTDAVNAVEADMVYDASKLQFNSIDFAGTAFDTAALASGGSGKIQIARGTAPGTTVTGLKKLATVQFTVLGNSGTTSVTFANTSHIVRASDATEVWNGSLTGGTYTMTAPPAPPPTPPAPPTPPTPTTPPVTTTPSSPAPEEVTPETMPDPEEEAAQESENFSLPTEEPIPVDIGADSPDTYPVAIHVVDGKSKPIQGVTVTLDNRSSATDSSGVASFASVKPGSYRVIARSSKAMRSQSIRIMSASNVTVQEFTVKLQTTRGFPFVLIGTIAGAALVLILLIFLARRARERRMIAKMYGDAANSAAYPIDSYGRLTTPLDEPSQSALSPSVTPGEIVQPNMPNEGQTHYPWVDNGR